MSTQTSSERASQAPSSPKVDMKLEVVVIPVSDVERAKQFYLGMGWRLDADFANGDSWRVVQVTPPAPRVPYTSARASRRQSPGRSRTCISSCPTSRRRAKSSPATAPR